MARIIQYNRVVPEGDNVAWAWYTLMDAHKPFTNCARPCHSCDISCPDLTGFHLPCYDTDSVKLTYLGLQVFPDSCKTLSQQYHPEICYSRFIMVLFVLSSLITKLPAWFEVMSYCNSSAILIRPCQDISCMVVTEHSLTTLPQQLHWFHFQCQAGNEWRCQVMHYLL